MCRGVSTKGRPRLSGGAGVTRRGHPWSVVRRRPGVGVSGGCIRVSQSLVQDTYMDRCARTHGEGRVGTAGRSLGREWM